MILAPGRRASVKATFLPTFAEALPQAIGECLSAIIVADSPSTQALLDTYSRTLHAMTAAKGRSRRRRRSTLRGGDLCLES